MARPLILSLADCADSRLVGGKAAGLTRLLAAGFAVPPGLCVTTEAYERSLQSIGFAPADNPTVAVAVVVENGGFGGSVAGPIGGRIMRAALGR